MMDQVKELAVPENVVIMKRPLGDMSRAEIEQVAHRVAMQIADSSPSVEADTMGLSQEVLDVLLEEERDYQEALANIETLVLELLASPMRVAEKVAEIKNKLQPVLMSAGDAQPLEVLNGSESYEDALRQILRITRALHNAGDQEWVATGVKLIQSLLPCVLEQNASLKAANGVQEA